MDSFVALPELALALALDGRSFEELADLAGTNVETLSRLVRGTTDAEPELRTRIAATLSADPEDLFLPHPLIRRLNRGRSLDDPEVGERIARLVRDRT